MTTGSKMSVSHRWAMIGSLLVLPVVRGRVGVEVVEQPARLVLLDVESGEPVQTARVMPGVDDLWADADGRAVQVSDDIELADVEAQFVQPADALVDAPHLLRLELFRCGELDQRAS